MNTMVSRVVEVLNEENPYMDHNRVLRSRLVKKRPRQRGERELGDKSKERQRKTVKNQHPNTPLKWGGHKWVTKSREHESRKEHIQEHYGLVPLSEISLRTGVIVGFMAKVKQYANKVDQGVSRMKSLASNLSSTDTPEKKSKIESELWKIDADINWNMRKMNMYGYLVSASGGLGVPKETVKLMSKIRGNRR